MKLDTVQVELRPRSAWEAMELGSALVRRHAVAIWKPWLCVVMPLFVLFNGVAWWSDKPWMAWIAFFLMWWLRPVFDRIPLYVLSRGVFGLAPSARETCRAQWRWGWRAMRGYLTWRRLSPMRAVMLPIDLLEGADARTLGERRRVIGAGVSGHTVLLTLAGLHFIWVLQLSALTLALLFVPNEKLPDFGRAFWELLNEQPQWLLIVFNAVDVLAVTIIEPFYVGAGFGLYLNRRTHLEAWDVEIAFRRMRQRLDQSAIAVLLWIVLVPLALPANASDDACKLTGVPPHNGLLLAQDGGSTEAKSQQTSPEAQSKAPAEAAEAVAAATEEADEDNAVPHRPLAEIFGDQTVDHRAFGKRVDQAYTDNKLRPKQQLTTWQPKNKPKEETSPTNLAGLEMLSRIFGFVAENILWLLLGVLVVVLAATVKRWLPWLRGMTLPPEAEPTPIDSRQIVHHEPLPPDVATVARRLWREGQPRRALALLYRASVEAMTRRIDAHLPPGATEADCLRLSRKLPEEADRSVFQRVVRMWQYAAYAHRFPNADEFEALVEALALRFRWSS